MNAADASSPSRPITKFTVVTPCRNARHLLPQTIESVLRQSAIETGRATLEYIICDGASTDGTASLAREMCGAKALVISEPDGSMYEALAKGLRRATGDVVAYLNAGDKYSPTAFDVVTDVLAAHPVRWVTGYTAILNARLQMVTCSLPFRYRRSSLIRGVHGRLLPWVQQESTFWRRSLHETVDWSYLERLRLAGDCYLWRCFASVTDLWIVEAYLGGFTVHGGHVSADRSAYWREAQEFLEPIRPADRVRAIVDLGLWKAPPRLKKLLNREHLLRYDHTSAQWR